MTQAQIKQLIADKIQYNMKHIIIILLALISFGVNAQTRKYPVGTSNARNQMKGLWEYSTTPNAYSNADSLRVVYYKQLQSVDTKLTTLDAGIVRDTVKSATTTTTDALNLDTLTAPVNSVAVYEVYATATSATNQVNTWVWVVSVKNLAGTYTYTRTMQIVAEENASNDADAMLLGGRVVVGVVAVAGGTVKWKVTRSLKHSAAL